MRVSSGTRFDTLVDSSSEAVSIQFFIPSSGYAYKVGWWKTGMNFAKYIPGQGFKVFWEK